MVRVQKAFTQVPEGTEEGTRPVFLYHRRATYRDLQDAPEHKVAEIIDGKLYAHPRPASPHALTGSAVGMKIGPPYQMGDRGPGGWWIIDEPELHLGQNPDDVDILVPDLAGWRRERMPEWLDTPYFTLPPDWICEVLSPSTRHLDLGSKRDIYARAGVPYLWLIDPRPRTLEACELVDGAWHSLATLAGDSPVSLPPFPEISFPLRDLWDS